MYPTFNIHLYKQKCFLTVDEEKDKTIMDVTVQSSDKHFNYTNYFKKEEKPSTLKDITETKADVDIHKNYENRQLMLIILAVLILLTSSYLGRCVYRQWSSRTIRASNTDTAKPNTTMSEIIQIGSHYDQVQDRDNDDQERYLTTAPDDNDGNGNISNISYQDASSVKNDTASIRAVVEATQDKAQNGENTREMYKNQPEETINLYITPCM